VIAPVLAALAALAALVAGLVRWRRNATAPARIVGDLTDETGTDDQGAVRSIQGGTLIMEREELDRIWNPMHLERLARTYWRFLSRCTLGLIRVKYTETERTVVLLFRPFRLLRFQAPEYEMDSRRGIVRWRIEDGVLVARRGRGGDGYLEIDVRREDPLPEDAEGCERLRVDIEVANFYPAIASRISRWVYANTQSRIHVIVTWGFLRSLARLDLAESRVGRFATLDEVPDPPAPGEGPHRAGDRSPQPVQP
jgi:hypothetical protein